MASEYSNKEFLREVQSKNIKGIKKALKKGADINYVDKSGRFALLLASDNSYYKVAKFVIKKGANVNYNLANSDGVTALMKTCERSFGTADIISLLIKKGARANAMNKNGESVLIRACCMGASDHAVITLLKQGADVNMQDNDGWSALMRASQQKHLEFEHVNYCLLKNGTKVNLQNNEGMTALMIACGDGKEERAQTLIANGALINLKNKQGQTALMTACKKGHTECVALLINNGADRNLQDEEGNSVLMIACDNGRESVQFLIGRGANINLQNNEGRSALMIACDVGYRNHVQLLIEKGADINLQDNEGRSALMRVCNKHHKNDIFGYLLESGADVNLQDHSGKTALMIASAKEKRNYVSKLLEHGSQLDIKDSGGNTALTLALYQYNMSLVEQLIGKGADMNLQNSKGQNLLMIACTKGHEQCVELLLEKGVETNLQDKEGLTALMIACKRRKEKIVQLLISKGKTEVDLQDHQGRTALMHSINTTEKDEMALYYKVHVITRVATSLVEHGANMDLQDNLGWSALMIACRDGLTTVCSMLLNKGANLSLSNIDGLTAFDIALKNKNKDLFSLFCKLRSDPSFPGILLSGGVRKESITATEKDIRLEDVGISLSIPKDALPSTDPPLDIQIQPCFSGSFEMPDNVELVSPAYIVSPSRKVAFQKEVLVKIWHHANLKTEEDCEDMVFLSASTSPQYRGDTPVYTFREIRGAKGSFRPGEEQPAGQIALKHFCILSLGKRTRAGSDDSPESKRQKILQGICRSLVTAPI